MPGKSDKLYIKDPFLDKRTKLLPCQKEMVHYWYNRGIGIRAITRMFHVSRRLIQFELFPERKQRDLENRKARGGYGNYYSKEKHSKYMKVHRDHKTKVLVDKDFKKPGN